MAWSWWLGPAAWYGGGGLNVPLGDSIGLSGGSRVRSHRRIEKRGWHTGQPRFVSYQVLWELSGVQLLGFDFHSALDTYGQDA